MNDTDNRKQRMNRCVERAVARIDEAMGYLNDAAQLANNGSGFHQVTYDLDRAITRARDAARDEGR